MPFALTPDKVKLYYEEVGQGTPILFVHEFAGDHRSWEPQLRSAIVASPTPRAATSRLTCRPILTPTTTCMSCAMPLRCSTI